MTRIDGHLSHRGRGLMLLGAVWVLVGCSTLVSGAATSIGPWAMVAPLWLRGALWIFTGSLAILMALVGAGQPRTKWAFGALMVPAMLRAASYLVALAASVVHHASHGSVDVASLIGGLAWVLVVVFVVHEASAPMIPATFRNHPSP